MVLTGLGLGLSCTDYLTAPGPQPKYLVRPERFDHRLCVLGVLRPDTSASGHPLSFVLLYRTFPPDTESFPPPLRDAEVLLFSLDETPPPDTLRLVNTTLGVFPDSAFRHPTFFPSPGKRYGLICRYPGYPALRAETRLPTRPRVIEGSLRASDEGLSFSVSTDPESRLLEIVRITSQGRETHRVIPASSGITLIFLPGEKPPPTPFRLQIIAYDRHLATYLSANLSIKPNVYQSPLSTVENGYGCFGSLGTAMITGHY